VLLEVLDEILAAYIFACTPSKDLLVLNLASFIHAWLYYSTQLQGIT
jgi:hypothetical protein